MICGDVWWLWFEHVCSGHVSVDMNAQRMHLIIRMAGNLGVKTRGDPATPEPSTTKNSSSSRSPKNSSAQRPDGEQVTTRNKGLMKIISRLRQISNRSIVCATSPFSGQQNRREHRARCTVTSKTSKHIP